MFIRVGSAEAILDLFELQLAYGASEARFIELLPANVALIVAGLITLAAVHFNRGLRGFYFATALLAWFIHPVALIAASVWVVLVLYRREFHSRTLALLRESKPQG